MPKKIWNKQDEVYLVENYSIAEFKEMIITLGKTKTQIQSKARLLGLKRNRTFHNRNRALKTKKIIIDDKNKVLKKCKKCEQFLPINNYYKHNETFDKLANECKQCKIKRSLNSVQNNKDFVKTYQKEYQEKNKDKLANYYLEYQRTSPKAKAIRKKYYLKNKDKIKLQDKLYRQTPEAKEKKRFRHQKRRAKIATLPHTLTIKEWEETKLYWTNENNQLTCAYCSCITEKPHQEHIIPVSKNGGYLKNNIIPSCVTCNLSKNNKDIKEFYLYSPSFKKENLSKILYFIKLHSNWSEAI